MNFVSVCSGVEAASLALEPIGFRAAAFAEVDPFCCDLLRQRWPGVPNLGDLTRWREWDLPDAGMLIGGTPCQAFSAAGARRSMKDARANLSLDFVELFHAGGFSIALWENVPGVLNTDDNAFGCFLGGLVGSDGPIVPTGRRARGRSKSWQWVRHRRFRHKGRRRYRKGFWKPVWPRSGMAAGPLARVAWRILDAQHFGLAQRRKRVFVVASSGAAGPDPAKILLEPKGVRGNSQEGGEERPDVAGALTAGFGERGATGLGPDEASAGHVVACYGGNNSTGAIDVATALNAHGGPAGRMDYESETFVTHALTAEGFDASVAWVGAIRGRDGGAQIEMEAELSPALRTCQGGSSHAIAFDARQSEVCVYGDRSGSLDTDGWTIGVDGCFGVRRLTPTECERLQGMPDGHTAITYKGKPGTDGPRYKGIGNSFAVLVVRWIGRRIMRTATEG